MRAVLGALIGLLLLLPVPALACVGDCDGDGTVFIEELIAAFDVPRSPGSTLKPLIYTRAIDRGIVLPEHLRPDVPVRYGTYAPENYDGHFTGVVQMEEALSRIQSQSSWIASQISSLPRYS